MRRFWGTFWIGLASLATAGCLGGSIQENPSFILPDPNVTVENPLWIPLGHEAYGAVYEKVLDIVANYFPIQYPTRFDGHIVTQPRISPGFEQIWKPGSPDCYQRLEATLQSIRHWGDVTISPAQGGGFFVKVIVYKELEDLPRPIRASAGIAAFRSDPTVAREYQVIEPAVTEPNWIPIGRDVELEQLILQRIKKCM
jgi:hypothetical protein